MTTWIFQANPDRYDIMAALANDEPINEWVITQHVDDLIPGDRAILWIAGRQAGVYGVGAVTGEPFTAVIDDPRWRRIEDQTTPMVRCPVDFPTILLEDPILKSELKQDPRFAGSRIISQPFAGSPLLVTDDEWLAIADRLPASQQVVPAPSVGTSKTTGNVNWVWDEIVLACGLVAARNWQTIPESDPEVEALSRFLGNRSTGSVHRKLEDIRTAHPDYQGAATKGGKTTRMVVQAFLSDPGGMHRAAQQLRDHGSLARPENDADSGWLDTEPDGESGPAYASAVEGRVVQRLVNVRERDPKLRNAKIKQVRKLTGAIACEICGFNFEAFYGELGEGFIHVHHLIPLHFSGETRSTLDDLVLVCVNCHQMIHRRSPWKTPEELRAIINARGDGRSS